MISIATPARIAAPVAPGSPGSIASGTPGDFAGSLAAMMTGSADVAEPEPALPGAAPFAFPLSISEPMPAAAPLVAVSPLPIRQDMVAPGKTLPVVDPVAVAIEPAPVALSVPPPRAISADPVLPVGPAPTTTAAALATSALTPVPVVVEAEIAVAVAVAVVVAPTVADAATPAEPDISVAPIDTPLAEPVVAAALPNVPSRFAVPDARATPAIASPDAEPIAVAVAVATADDDDADASRDTDVAAAAPTPTVTDAPIVVPIMVPVAPAPPITAIEPAAVPVAATIMASVTPAKPRESGTVVRNAAELPAVLDTPATVATPTDMVPTASSEVPPPVDATAPSSVPRAAGTPGMQVAAAIMAAMPDARALGSVTPAAVASSTAPGVVAVDRPIAARASAPVVGATVTRAPIDVSPEPSRWTMPAPVAPPTTQAIPVTPGAPLPSQDGAIEDPAAIVPTAQAPVAEPSRWTAPTAAPVALAAIQPAPLQPGMVASAAQVFGAAMQAIVAQDEKPRMPDAAIAALSAPTVTNAVAATADAQAPLDMRQERWPETMIARIEVLRDMANAGDTRMRLIPDALGTIDVSVKRDGDGVQVHFNAEQAQTRTLLQDAQPRLAELAEARGIKLTQNGVAGSGVDAGTSQQRQPTTPQAATPKAPARARAAAATDSTDTRLA